MGAHIPNLWKSCRPAWRMRCRARWGAVYMGSPDECPCGMCSGGA